MLLCTSSEQSGKIGAMPIRDQIISGASRLRTLLSGDYSDVSIEGVAVRLEGSAGRPTSTIPVESISAIDLQRSWLRYRLVLQTFDGKEHSVGGLEHNEATHIREAILETAKRRQPEVCSLVSELAGKLDGLFDGSRYVRRSDADAFHLDFVSQVGRCRGLVEEALDPEVQTELHRLAALASPRAFEAERSRTNRVFVDNHIPAVQETALRALSTRLTDEQAEAVVTDEDATLVLAGAGTGKTAVIVGKAVHLVRNQGISPGEILILAFNRKAAEELRERLPDDLRETQVSTFHAFGRRVIAESDVAPSISRLAADQYAFTQAIDGIISKLLRDPQRSGPVMEYIAYRPAPYRSAFDFSTPGEYAQYVQTVELRTLNGYLVRSFEEMVVANFLTEHGVPFKYEQPYDVDTATKRYSQYRPDFYLPKHNIYIEHFALNKQGHPPPGWTTYAEGVAWKRQLHEVHGTRLIETYSWQQSDGTLQESLRASLEAEGVEMEKIDSAELVLQLARHHISALARVLAPFLTHAKGARLSNRELTQRGVKHRDSDRAKGFLAIYESVRDEYERLLAAERSVDFHDLINGAAELIGQGTWESPFRYVLVDEFQDISAGRMALLKALRSPGVAYFMVGDDWQSIYRFAGSDVQLMRNSQAHLGHVEERPLSRTFRFGKGILGPSSAFVQVNPEQTRRTLRPADTAEDRGVTVVSDRSPATALLTALNDIDEVAGDDPRSVLILGRYQKSGRALSGRTRPAGGNLNIRFSTVHRAKGQEADYVVVLDLTNKMAGFPSRIEDDPLMELVLPPLAGEAFPVAEERRLFYVALTRARLGVYLTANSAKPSEFVTELLGLFPDLRQLGRPPLNCPRCSNGFLSASKTERTMMCSNRPHCKIRVPLCPGCNLGYALVVEGEVKCLNPVCDDPAEVCPTCGKGLLLSRKGPTGPFWACTEFWSEPPCRFTRPIRPRGRRNRRRRAR